MAEEETKPQAPVVPEWRCKQDDLHLVAQSPFGTHYACRTVHPIAKMMNPRYFLNQRMQLRVGDTIDIYRCENDKWQRIIEQAKSVTVVACDALGVELAPTTVQDLGVPGEQGIVVGRGFAGKFVIRIDGETRATRNTIVEANEYAEALGVETGRPVKLFEKKAA